MLDAKIYPARERKPKFGKLGEMAPLLKTCINKSTTHA